MSEPLSTGMKVRGLDTKNDYTIDILLGQGGQGDVYRAICKGNQFAIKWYNDTSVTPQQRANIESLVRNGAPDARFLWPTEIVTAQGNGSFGYVMKLRPPQYKSIQEIVMRKANPTFRAITTAGIQLADCFNQLHSKGWCYSDISLGNAFMDPDTGEVLICDNDNVVVDNSSYMGVGGTPKFMAPEIVKGEKSPSSHTDLYSLAVLLFHMFVIHHPLDGALEAKIRCMDLPALTKLYGTHPVYIFDPQDKSNLPVKGLQDNPLLIAPLLPATLMANFATSFTVGLHCPDKRVRTSSWRVCLTQLRDLIYKCSSCGAQSYYGTKPKNCWRCTKPLVQPMRFHFQATQATVVVINPDTYLFPHHTVDKCFNDFSSPTAQVVRNPKDPRIWGLKNLSSSKWIYMDKDGVTQTDVDTGRTISLIPGGKIKFGNNVVAEIKY